MDKLCVTLVRGLSGRTQKQRACVRSLGLRKINSSRVFDARPDILGNINKVRHLVRVERCEKDSAV